MTDKFGSFVFGLISVFYRIIYILSKRKSEEHKLGKSRSIQSANKQIIKTCVVVTLVYLASMGE